MLVGMLALFGALIGVGPWLDAGEGPNACYLVDHDMRQVHGPCRPEETRGWRR